MSSSDDIGDYRTVCKMDGGMGQVRVLEHKTNGHKIAIKMLAERFSDEPTHLALFLREMRQLSLLHHPNIVAHLPEPQFPGGFAMEYCNGGDLSDFVARRGGCLSVDAATSIIFQVLDGLDYIHKVEIAATPLSDGSSRAANGLVHRDLKPKNILLVEPSAQPTAKIADFGLSKVFEWAGFTGLTATDQYGGTLEYMSRSQLENYRNAKPEVDVWAAAAILYFMLTGESPRNFSDEFTPDRVVLEHAPIPIRRRLRGAILPAALAELVDHALLDCGPLTYQSARSFKNALLAIV